MHNLLQRQQIIADAIDRVETNFKKDSASRKTAEYIQKRLDSLNSLWAEFKVIHAQLLAFEDKSDEYFTTNAHDGVKTRYEAIRQLLLNYKPETTDRGVPSKSDELISLQSTNFRALNRLIRHIDLNSISERWEIEDKLQMLQSRWKIIDDTHWQIDNLLLDSNVDYEQDFTKNEALYESTKRELHQKLNTATSQSQSLPKIEIPTLRCGGVEFLMKFTFS